jgi:hypothetical protein
MAKHPPEPDLFVFLQNCFDALLDKEMHRFTLRALAALLVRYDSEAEWTLTKLSAKLGIPIQASSYTLKRLASEGLVAECPTR